MWSDLSAILSIFGGICVPVIVGETGLGKSTLINSLFLTDLYKDRKVPNAEGEFTFIIYPTIQFFLESF